MERHVTFEEFRISIKDGSPPPVAGTLMEALWHDARGDWEKAHAVAQLDSSNMACRVHAYLHRKEGDLGNASYWYSRAGKTTPPVPTDQEWETLVRELIYHK